MVNKYEDEDNDDDDVVNAQDGRKWSPIQYSALYHTVSYKNVSLML